MIIYLLKFILLFKIGQKEINPYSTSSRTMISKLDLCRYSPIAYILSCRFLQITGNGRPLGEKFHKMKWLRTKTHYINLPLLKMWIEIKRALKCYGKNMLSLVKSSYQASLEKYLMLCIDI